MEAAKNAGLGKYGVATNIQGEFDLGTEAGRNMAAAEKAIKEVRSHLTLGTNTEKDCKNFLENERIIATMREEVKQQALEYSRRNNCDVPFEVTMPLYVEALKKYHYGQCGEIASAVFMALKEQGVSPLLYCETSEGEHALVVIGANKDMCGTAPVVADGWAMKRYPLSEFKKMQQMKYDVRYAPERYPADPFTPPYRLVAPYLAGMLEPRLYYSTDGGYENVTQLMEEPDW